MDSARPHGLLPLPESPDPQERLNAIRFPGEMGDVEALAALRARLKAVSAEHTALVVAVGKLKRRLKVN
jgi:hypothetical protein